MYLIEKKPTIIDLFNRPYFVYNSARDGFTSFLNAVGIKKNEKVLLPSYIGWSSNEGSGVFDPINKLKLGYEFYKVTSKLEIDIEELEISFRNNNIKVFVIIHYFGYVDNNYEKAIAIANKNNALILEDEAHAMLTDLVGGKAGRLGDACIYSLHKMLPMKNGGILLFNKLNNKLIHKIKPQTNKTLLPWQFDLKSISEKRLSNVKVLSQLLLPLKNSVEPLRKKLKEGEVPQTYPIIVKRGLRDKLYFSLNDSGYGAVSLYHTMIKQLNKELYPDSFDLSASILNLPVHQNIEEPMLKSMVLKIKQLLEK